MFGSGAAVVLRIILTVVAAKLLELSFLQIVGGCLLLWIGLQLLTGEEDDEGESKGHGSMMVAIRTILIADLVMSLDNVIAVAATAQGNMVLLILGLAISIPLVIFGSTLMIKLMERFPVIITLGAALIGWVGGETIVNDRLLHGYAISHPWLHYGGRSRRRAGRGHWQVPAGALRRKARSPGLTLPQAAPSPHHERTAPAVRFCFVRTHLDVASS